jgi:hypothetical protein
MTMNVPFPQANDISSVLSFVSATAKGKTTDLPVRQRNYILAAAEFLGLMSNGQITEQGKSVVSKRSLKARLSQVKTILSTKPVFSKVLSVNYEPSLNQVATMVQTTTYLSDVTSRRRASTVLNWVSDLKAVA